jgi:hypothetical protein
MPRRRQHHTPAATAAAAGSVAPSATPMSATMLSAAAAAQIPIQQHGGVAVATASATPSETSSSVVQLQPAEITDNPAVLEGDVLCCPPQIAKPYVVASHQVSTCVVLVLQDKKNSANCAVGHFDTPHHLNDTVSDLVKEVASHGVSPANMKAILVGGSDADDYRRCSAFCDCCCSPCNCCGDLRRGLDRLSKENDSNDLISRPIKEVLAREGIPSQNITHNHSSRFAFFGSTYNVYVARNSDEVLVDTKDRDVAKVYNTLGVSKERQDTLRRRQRTLVEVPIAGPIPDDKRDLIATVKYRKFKLA